MNYCVKSNKIEIIYILLKSLFSKFFSNQRGYLNLLLQSYFSYSKKNKYSLCHLDNKYLVYKKMTSHFYKKHYGYEDDIQLHDDDIKKLEIGMNLRKMNEKGDINDRFYRLDLVNK